MTARFCVLVSVTAGAIITTTFIVVVVSAYTPVSVSICFSASWLSTLVLLVTFSSTVPTVAFKSFVG